MSQKPIDNSAPPAYPSQAHSDAGYGRPGGLSPASPAPPAAASPYNVYGGFNNPSQAHLPDPRSGSQYTGSPAPGAAPYGYPGQGPPQQYGYGNGYGGGGAPPPQGYYGAPQQGYYPPQQLQQQQPMPPAQYGYASQQGYQQGPGGRAYGRQGPGAGEGVCAALLGVMACCCCLDFLV